MKVELELSEHNNIGEYSLGYFAIKNMGIVFTNKFQKPNQAFMIFHSLPLLFDGLNRLIINNGRVFVFQPIDCSYEIVFERQKENLKIYEDSKSSIVCDFNVFALELFIAYNEIMNHHKLTIDNLNDIKDDFETSLSTFKTNFITINKL